VPPGPPPVLPGAPAPPGAAAALVAPLAASAPAPTLPAAQAATTTAPQPAVPAGPAGVRPGEQPGSLQPQAPKRPHKVVEKTKPSRRLQPGDLICGDCGEGNAPVRKFCSRCGSSLAQAEVVKQKWWQKLFPKRKPKVLEAGQRPGREGVKKKRKVAFQPVFRVGRLVIGGLLLVGGIVYAVYGPFRGFVNERFTSAKESALDVVQQDPVAVRAVELTANTEPPPTVPCDQQTGNVACRVIDQKTNTFWEFAPPADAFTPTLTLRFDRPVNIDRIIVHNGAGDDFTSFGRVTELHFVFGPGNTSADVALDDVPDPVEYEIDDGQNVETVQIQITEIINAATPGANITLTEIEFFQLD
jgi:hypothetical protein